MLQIPAFAGMTWEGAGMTGVGVGMMGEMPRACAHEFSPHSAAFCRILSRPAEGDLGN